MKKRVSFKLFFTVLWRGVCQAVQKVARWFGYKGESSYWQVIWRMVAGCFAMLLLIFTIVVSYNFFWRCVWRDTIKPMVTGEVYTVDVLSRNVLFQRDYSGEGWIYNLKMKKTLVENVTSVYARINDSLLIVAVEGGKSGFVNRFTGEVAVPTIYSRVWDFSDGLAAVEREGELLFVDRAGNVVIDKDFTVSFEMRKGGYKFINGYCAIIDPITDQWGLIDREGNMVLNTEYEIDNIDGFWMVKKGGKYGLYNAEMKEMFPMEYKYIAVNAGLIKVVSDDNTSKLYEYDGSVVEDFVIDDVANLRYETTELLKEPYGYDDSSETPIDKVYAIADLQRYGVCVDEVSMCYGLMNRAGKRVTPPIYNDIKAISKDLYLCEPNGVILNARGEKVK